MNIKKRKLTAIYLSVLVAACMLLGHTAFAQKEYDPSADISYCAAQAGKTIAMIPSLPPNMPRSIDREKKDWNFVGIEDWCSGFWPGILWSLYEATGDSKWRMQARKVTNELTPLNFRRGFDHDIGFQIFNSFGKGYLLTGDPAYKKITLRAADSLATLFNPTAGTILSWPLMVKKMNWPHNTIIDNMMNLELLFWASKNGADHRLYDIAVSHAETTMHNHFRPDYSAYHVVVYDTVTGKRITGLTHQGYADNSMWSRGQSWAIYGFTMCYRETKKREFLDFAQNVADLFLKRLPADGIPYWDFDDPAIPNAPHDASAAAITASALLELSTFIIDKRKADNYRKQALAILSVLSSPAYRSNKTNSAFLLHSTGHHPAGTEVDAAIIYADYYYLEALVRLKNLRLHRPYNIRAYQ